MGSADDILDVIDAGLQQSSEDDVVQVDPTLCARCQANPPSAGDLCGGCRTYLLGDTDLDPKPPELDADCPVCSFIEQLGVPMTRLQVYLLHQAAIQQALRNLPAPRVETHAVITRSGAVIFVGSLTLAPDAPVRGMTASATWLDEIVDEDWHPPMQHPGHLEDDDA